MKTTTNHGLKKPDGTEIVNIDDLNYNADKLDGLLVPASTTVNGLMSKDDKTKLNGIAAGANNYTHPAMHPASMTSGLSTIAKSGSYNDLLNKPSTFTPASHDHDDRYYTETEINSKLNGKANTSHTHTKSQISDFPTSLPANGGNADTVDGKHASDFMEYYEHPSGTSLDALVAQGIHWVYKATGVLPSGYPTNVHDFVMTVYPSGRTNTLYQTHMLYEVGASRMFKRIRENGVNKPWVEIYTTENFPSNKFAPGGYGLGTTCVNVTDWNNATNNGYYMGSNATNAPDTGWWMGQVFCHNVNWIVQKVCAFSNSKQWYTRYKVNGIWMAWEVLNDRKTYTSTAEPSGGNNGDVWIKYS